MNNLRGYLPNWFNKIALLLVALAFPVVHAYAAASVTLSPTQETVPQNNTFTVTLSINTDNNSVTGSDVTLQYAPTGLQYVSATNGNFFPNMTPASDPSTGQLVIHGYVTNFTDAKTGSGNIATIVFKVLQSSGSSNISFICSGSGHDTNIVAASGQNVLACAQVNQVGVVYGTAVPTNTPTPTPTPGPGTPTPTPGPSATAPTCTGLNSDISSAVGVPLAVTFTCSGVYSNGYINAAYFSFGDGTVDTIAKNVGGNGSISTTHTYTTIGSLGASCKVQNNDQVWSSTCAKIVYINPKPQVTRTYAYLTQTSTTSTATPTPLVVALVPVTPTATPTAQLTPVPTTAPPGQGSSAFMWLIISVGIILLGGIIYLLSRKKAPPPPPWMQPPSTPSTTPPQSAPPPQQ